MRDDERIHVRNRAHAIILLFEDHRAFDDVASFFSVHINTVRNWAKRWAGQGICGLYDLPGRGVKPLYSDAEEDIILECLEQDPRSLRRVSALVEQRTGKAACLNTLTRIIKKHGKTWKRKRKVLKTAPTEEEYEQGKTDIKELKLLAQDGEFTLVYFDASGLSLQPYVPYAWQDIGREGTLGIASSRSIQINLLGFLNPTSPELAAYQYVGPITSAVIIEVMDEYCGSLIEPVVVIIDNAPIHTSRAVAAKFRDWEKRGLTLFFLPPYSPQLNLIEILWRKIKYEWMPSWAYASMTSLEIALDGILNLYGSEYTIAFSQ